jgi:hypothetical protein
LLVDHLNLYKVANVAVFDLGRVDIRYDLSLAISLTTEIR